MIACQWASSLGATVIGVVGGLLVVTSIVMLDKLKIDDPVGAISVHGVVGIWGLMVVPYTNSDASLGTQFIGMITILGLRFMLRMRHELGDAEAKP